MAKLRDEFGFEYEVPVRSSIAVGRHRECDISIPPCPEDGSKRDLDVFFSRPEFNHNLVEAAARAKYGMISRAHAVMSVGENGTTIRDADSTHGTYVNKSAVGKEPVSLVHNDLIHLGELCLTYEVA